MFDPQFHSFQNLHRQYWSETEFQFNAGHWKWKKGILKENTSSSRIHNTSIDQGPKRLGGYSSVHAARWGAPLFLRLYSMLNHGRNSEYFKFIICPDVNFRVWNASEFNKSKTLFEECSRCSLLHIQKICVKRYMKCLYFSLKLIGLPGCSIRFWKSKKGNIQKSVVKVLQSCNTSLKFSKRYVKQEIFDVI